MNYKKYQQSRNLAWQILLEENIRQLPVSTLSLCRGMGIPAHSYQHRDRSDAYSTILDGQAHIFVSGTALPQRQRFSVAHELGHILLGHVGRYRLVCREPDPKDNPIAQEANVFGSRLLAPACVLWALNARTPEEIAALCQISYQAAVFRAQRMDLLYRRRMFLSSPLERAVYAQFSEFIRNNR